MASPAVRPKLLSAGPLGYGPQLLACRSDRLVSHCARKAGLAELGVDLSRFGGGRQVMTSRVPVPGRGDAWGKESSQAGFRSLMPGHVSHRGYAPAIQRTRTIGMGATAGPCHVP